MLLGSCASWGLSFPLMRAYNLFIAGRMPEASSWFAASWSLAVRFAGAALLMLAWLAWRGQWRGTTRLERDQGLALGLFTALGMLLQCDGLSYTHASTSAFLTQCYCIFVPAWLALRGRRLPPVRVMIAALLVMAGIAILAGVDWRTLRLGRGEWETIGASAVFTAQILCVERPAYAGNHPLRVSCLAFAVSAALFLPVALATAPGAHQLVQAVTDPAAALCLLTLTLVSTLLGMVLMFTWQRHLEATAAALIYGCEPLFASAFAFVLPGLLATALGIAYANEHFTPSLVIGGALIIGANVLVQLRPQAQR
jgi:drug/metabolite transporter (DMT)-like permease